MKLHVVSLAYDILTFLCKGSNLFKHSNVRERSSFQVCDEIGTNESE